MKILSFVFATAFFAPLFLVKAQIVPAEVEALFSDIKENLNAGHHLRLAHGELIASLKADTSSSFWDGALSELYGLAPGLIPQLADDEMVNFIAACADFNLTCLAEADSGIDVKIHAPFSRRQESSICEQGLPGFMWGAIIETREEFDDALRFLNTHSANLKQIAKTLTQNSYWTKLPFQGHGPVGTDSTTPKEREAINRLLYVFNQDELYLFYFIGNFGMIGFKNGQAKLLRMAPFSYSGWGLSNF